MKKLILLAFLFIGTKTFAQDSTKVKNLQLMTRVVEYLIPICMDPSNDSLFQVYQDLRPKFRISNPPSGNTLVTIDSIPTVELAKLYNYALSNNDGMAYGSQIRTQIAAARRANSYLDRLCTAYEVFWDNRMLQLRAAGRVILRGK